MTDKELIVTVQCIEDRVAAAGTAVVGLAEMTDVQRVALQELEAAKALLHVVNEHLQKHYDL